MFCEGHIPISNLISPAIPSGLKKRSELFIWQSHHFSRDPPNAMGATQTSRGKVDRSSCSMHSLDVVVRSLVAQPVERDIVALFNVSRQGIQERQHEISCPTPSLASEPDQISVGAGKKIAQQGMFEPDKLLIGNADERLLPVCTEFQVEACGPNIGIKGCERRSVLLLLLFQDQVYWGDGNPSCQKFRKTVKDANSYGETKR